MHRPACHADSSPLGESQAFQQNSTSVGARRNMKENKEKGDRRQTQQEQGARACRCRACHGPKSKTLASTRFAFLVIVAAEGSDGDEGMEDALPSPAPATSSSLSSDPSLGLSLTVPPGSMSSSTAGENRTPGCRPTAPLSALLSTTFSFSACLVSEKSSRRSRSVCGLRLWSFFSSAVDHVFTTPKEADEEGASW